MFLSHFCLFSRNKFVYLFIISKKRVFTCIFRKFIPLRMVGYIVLFHFCFLCIKWRFFCLWNTQLEIQNYLLVNIFEHLKFKKVFFIRSSNFKYTVAWNTLESFQWKLQNIRIFYLKNIESFEITYSSQYQKPIATT